MKAAIAVIDLIYSHARTVVSALDKIRFTRTEVESIILYGSAFEGNPNPSDTPLSDLTPPHMIAQSVLHEAFRTLISDSWFSCAWSSHEMRLGQHYIFLVNCDRDDESAQQILRFTSSFFKHLLALYIQCPKRVPLGPESASFEVAQNRKNMIELLHRRFGKRDLYEFLRTHSEVRHQIHPDSYVPTVAEMFHYSEAGGNPLIQNIELRMTNALKYKLPIVLDTPRTGLVLHRTCFRIRRAETLKTPVSLIYCSSL